MAGPGCASTAPHWAHDASVDCTACPHPGHLKSGSPTAPRHTLVFCRREPLEPYWLFDGHALREVTRLVYVGASQIGDVVGQQLKRDSGDQRGQKRRRRRHFNQVIAAGWNVLVVVIGDRNHSRGASPNLLDVSEDLLIGDARLLRGDHHHWKLLVDQRDRTVLHLAAGKALGMNVSALLELERALQRDREDAAPS